MFGQLKMVKMLIEKGADPFIKNKKGKTPQEVAHHSLQNYFQNLISGTYLNHTLFYSVCLKSLIYHGATKKDILFSNLWLLIRIILIENIDEF
jgi:hypothetical protein